MYRSRVNRQRSATAAHLALIAGASSLMEEEEEEQASHVKSTWIKKWLMNKDSGTFHSLFQELLLDDEAKHDFNNYCRMSPNTFFYILHKIEHLIQKEDTEMRNCIPAGARLEATLRYVFLITYK